MTSERESQAVRAAVAEAVDALLASKITWEEFMDRVPEDTDDEDIAHVIDLIEHEPKRGGFLGVTEDEYQCYMGQLARAVARLRE